eukprot:8774516-Alexandrium_andersonii.AAC.1
MKHKDVAMATAAKYLRALILRCPPREQNQSAPLPCARTRCACAHSGTTGARAGLATLIT